MFNLTSISLSYYFLILGLLFLIAFFYFKVIFIKTDDKNSSRDKIIGTMKDPKQWRSKNNFMSYICIFWFLVSIAIFTYMKYFTYPKLISGIYLIIFACVSIVSVILPLLFNKDKDRAH